MPESADSFGGVIAAPMPDHPIAKCKADVGLISHLLPKRGIPHILVPTTAGTGSETTRVLVMTDEVVNTKKVIYRNAFQKP